ncbi:hypothetical protein [Paenibacillus sp. sgz5001063]|uniref:hypothetical protein n=1 Tax=Paenibacillus sp. sgz5001063 TaxID=3242474 RepID=UPI0036D2B018
MTTVLILVEQDDNLMRYLPIIKKNTNLSFAEIRSNIIAGIPIAKIILFRDEDEDTKLKLLINELEKLGARLKLFEDELENSREISVNYLFNRFDRFREIQEQNEMLDDLIYGEDED